MTRAGAAQIATGGGERRLRIPAALDRIADARRFVRESAEAAGTPIDCLEDLVQAVDEAATNAVIHGYAGAPGWLEVGTALDGDEFVVTLEDAAPAFDPTSCPDPDLSVPPLARRPGGMGVHLIRESTDRMTWQPRPGGGNILTMARALRRDPKEDG